MLNKLKVSFDEPNAGTIQMTLQYNSFFPLVDALLRLKNAPGEATIAWQCEPSEYELRFSRQTNTVSLQVLLFRDAGRSAFDEPQPELLIAGSYNEVCLPFWRALRQLQGRFSENEWKVRWQRPFPSRELDLLTTALGK